MKQIFKKNSLYLIIFHINLYIYMYLILTLFYLHLFSSLFFFSFFTCPFANTTLTSKMSVCDNFFKKSSFFYCLRLIFSCFCIQKRQSSFSFFFFLLSLPFYEDMLFLQLLPEKQNISQTKILVLE